MKAKIWVKEDYELPELTYQDGNGFRGGFTLLESPSEKRVYIVDTSKEIIDQIKNDEKYEWIENIEESL